MKKVLAGEESLTAVEAFNLSQYMLCDLSYLFSPVLSALDRKSRRHCAWIAELNRKLGVIWEASKNGDTWAADYMNGAKRTGFVNMELKFQDGRQVTYAEYKAVKLEMDWTLSLIREKEKVRRGLNPLSEYEGWQVVDADLKVLSSTVDGIPQWVKEQFLTDTPYDDIKSLTFFYSPKVDAIVLNREHHNADFYEILVTTYLGSEEETRNRIKEEIPQDTIGTAFDLLDFIVKERGQNGRDNM